MGNQSIQQKQKPGSQRQKESLQDVNKHSQFKDKYQSKNSRNLQSQMNQRGNLNRLIAEDMPLYSVKLIQYIFNFLNITEVLQLKLVNKKLKFMVELSSNIYANYLSQLFIRKIQISSFIEYGSDLRFQAAFGEQLLKIELNQDESWLWIYQSFQKSKLMMNHLNREMNLTQNLSDLIVNSLIEPLLPIAILTDDQLKQATTSWFQLYMAQNSEDVNCNIQADFNLNEKFQFYYLECLDQYQIQNLQHTQLLMEIKWVIIDNFIRDPSTISNAPTLLTLAANILHMLYLRCLFSRNVLRIIQKGKVQAQILNFYVVLWKTYMGTIWSLNIYFEELFKYIDQIFNQFYKTSIPSYSFLTIAGRIWTQVILKEKYDQTQYSESIEQSILQSFNILLSEKRYQLLQVFILDQEQQSSLSNITKNQIFKDQYFQQISNAINCLLGHLSSSLLDISMHELSIHWIGHSKLKVGQPYAALLQNIVKDTQAIYQRASQLFGQNYSLFQEYIQSDSKFLQEIINRWTVQIIILPIGLNYLQETIKKNLRKLIINYVSNKPEITIDQDFIIVPANQFLNTPNSEKSIQADALTNIIKQIIKEEKLIKQEQTQETIEPNQFKYIQSRITEEPSNTKYGDLSKYSMSNKSSQITEWKSSYSQIQETSNIEQSEQEQALIQQLSNHFSNEIWVQYLNKIKLIEFENQVKIDKRNSEIEWRNKIRKINLKISEKYAQILDFNYIPDVEKILSYFEHNHNQGIEQISFSGQTNHFIEINANGQSLINYLDQQEIVQ
ncbi:unnamed protein product (macronuclear) [Paramecium tetraurelia]|uniref:F-box domain-containing protein n=1 Tax=Paramecium tetraurelia TaxID=5888 RepID=A0DDH4_PARTE|nr:uncharacterized protein GSPATT00015951001 [Paramecium tetraurelia]CAK81091.1 unnamed protein product [Paramecium tetraurelia]|eukprot:XP_001448488.1 hypothetical protein (macronuclear) [Paramecium tetraurelia strain d4-2]